MTFFLRRAMPFGEGKLFVMDYPPIPWLGIMLIGFAFGELFELPEVDVLFYQGTTPATIPGVTFVNVSPTVSGSVNPQLLANGTYGELHWLDNVTRQWGDYMYLSPIPYTDLTLNPNLLQNPVWQ